MFCTNTVTAQVPQAIGAQMSCFVQLSSPSSGCWLYSTESWRLKFREPLKCAQVSQRSPNYRLLHREHHEFRWMDFAASGETNPKPLSPSVSPTLSFFISLSFAVSVISPSTSLSLSCSLSCCLSCSIFRHVLGSFIVFASLPCQTLKRRWSTAPRHRPLHPSSLVLRFESMPGARQLSLLSRS